MVNVIASRIAASGAAGRVVAPVGAGDGDVAGIVEGADDEDEDGEDTAGDDEEDQDSVLALVKSVPGNVSLNSMLTEVRKLQRPGRSACRRGCSPTSRRRWCLGGGRGPRWSRRRTCAVGWGSPRRRR